jgi:2-oxoglutarate ferredoxin oxidoreductase subunit delta
VGRKREGENEQKEFVYFYQTRYNISNTILRRAVLAQGKPVISSEKCKGCGLCIGACPKSILELSDDFNKQGVQYPVCIDEDKCIACKFCAIICPDMAIEILKVV